MSADQFRQLAVLQSLGRRNELLTHGSYGLRNRGPRKAYREFNFTDLPAGSPGGLCLSLTPFTRRQLVLDNPTAAVDIGEK